MRKNPARVILLHVRRMSMENTYGLPVLTPSIIRDGIRASLCRLYDGWKIPYFRLLSRF